MVVYVASFINNVRNVIQNDHHRVNGVDLSVVLGFTTPPMAPETRTYTFTKHDVNDHAVTIPDDTKMISNSMDLDL